MASIQPPAERWISGIRRFNRFYTKRIGALREGLSDSPYSLTQARVIYELAHRKNASAAEIAKELGLDEGYLSRLLRGLSAQGIVSRKPSSSDGRRNLLSLTPRGAQAFGALDRAARDDAGAMADSLRESDRTRLVEAMETIVELLEPSSQTAAPYLLRSHRPGDMGWVVRAHGAGYHSEHGWDETFEALAAEIAAAFLREHDPKREHCWIAERDGENAGSVLLVRESDDAARLRLLYVDPAARGLGIGARLVLEAVRFARAAGYRKIVLWTNDVLRAARRVYEEAGFQLVDETPHHSFGTDLIGQTWELTL